MIEVCIFPIGRVMTGRTICAVLSFMFIILLVAGEAVHRCTLVHAVLVAGFARDLRMFPFQFEDRQIVIEPGRRPTLCSVTLAAVQSKAPIVRLITLVTGIAILQCHFEVTQTTCIDMTLHAGKTDMLARNLERKDIVIEVLPKTIHAIVTIETGGTKRQRMRSHESQVYSTMAIIAGVQSEGRDVSMVTITADERPVRRRGRELMSV